MFINTPNSFEKEYLGYVLKDIVIVLRYRIFQIEIKTILYYLMEIVIMPIL